MEQKEMPINTTALFEKLVAFVKRHGLGVDSGTYGSGCTICKDCGANDAGGPLKHKDDCVVGAVLGDQKE